MFVRDDECATVRSMFVKNPPAHALVSRLRRLIPYRFQVGKLDSLLIGFVLDGGRSNAAWLAWFVLRVTNRQGRGFEHYGKEP